MIGIKNQPLCPKGHRDLSDITTCVFGDLGTIGDPSLLRVMATWRSSPHGDLGVAQLFEI